MREASRRGGSAKEPASAAAVLVFRPDQVGDVQPGDSAKWFHVEQLLLSGADTLALCPEVGRFVVVGPNVVGMPVATFSWQWPKFLAMVAAKRNLWGSVKAGVEALPEEFQAVVVHDAARPLASSELFARVVRALDGADAVIPQLPITDTVKRVEQGRVRETIPRESLVEVQTPQGFRRRAIDAVSSETSGLGSWAAPLALFSASRLRLVTIPGDPKNVVVRTLGDLLRRKGGTGPRGFHGR